MAFLPRRELFHTAAEEVHPGAPGQEGRRHTSHRRERQRRIQHRVERRRSSLLLTSTRKGKEAAQLCHHTRPR